MGRGVRIGFASAPRAVRELRPAGEHPVRIEIVDGADIRLPQAPIASSCQRRKVTDECGPHGERAGDWAEWNGGAVLPPGGVRSSQE